MFACLSADRFLISIESNPDSRVPILGIPLCSNFASKFLKVYNKFGCFLLYSEKAYSIF